MSISSEGTTSDSPAERWIIETWAGRRVFTDKEFPSFEEARSFISEHANAVTTSEDEYDDVCEHLYAVRL